MANLEKDLEILRELNELRSRAKELRQMGVLSLKGINNIIDNDGSTTKYKIVTENEELINEKFYDQWISGRNLVETALLVKVQNHRDINENDKYNNIAEASQLLKNELTNISLNDLFPKEEDQPASLNARATVPLVVAARGLQSLCSRSETTISQASMFCYYRIIREIYGASKPDWTVGAARAGTDGKTSAFVTGECVRAIFSFRNAITRNITFFTHILEFYKRFKTLESMLENLGIKDKEDEEKKHPLSRWADRAIERMWLDCYITTNPRSRQIALFKGNAGKNIILPELDSKTVGMAEVKTYFDSFLTNLNDAINEGASKVKEALIIIKENRNKEYPENKIDETFEDKEFRERFDRTQSAHSTALNSIENAFNASQKAKKLLSKYPNGIYENTTEDILNLLITQSKQVERQISRILEPTQQYLKTVLRRELAAPESSFDAGELVFAASAYGALINWRTNELLTRACEMLFKHLPNNGRLPTKRPLHATRRGYQMLPIGCEMTRGLAQLLTKTNFEVEPEQVVKILSLFEENLIELEKSKNTKGFGGWNFENAPNPNRPSVWVTAVATLSLDRIVRMLNSRINNVVLRNFEVISPKRPASPLDLNSLIYPDYGFTQNLFGKSEKHKDQRSIPIYLEQMRAHIVRSSLPTSYLPPEKEKERLFSAVLYGPPGTGKTTFAEALGLSSDVPVVKLSPSDLIVQGQELMEGRARDVFEALSMLTQAVVILDEFEPVLKERGSDENTIKAQSKSKSILEATDKTIGALLRIADKDDPKFRFLLAGMLPKLIKMHNAAKNQSLAYVLATNYIKDIDDAAKRVGRFDVKIPVYNPCPLSRAGTFLYRLCMVNKDWKLDSTNTGRLIEVIQATCNQPASEIVQNFFKIDEKKNEFESAWFSYFLTNEDKPTFESEQFEKLKKDFKSLDEGNDNRRDERENRERHYLRAFEEKIKDMPFINLNLETIFKEEFKQSNYTGKTNEVITEKPAS